MVVRALELLRDASTLNVRILTRSPMAAKYFPLFKSFGHRLLFGMSLPTLDDKLRAVYEPQAPGISARLNCLRSAKSAGLNVFVVMAPTFPECDEADLLATLKTIKQFAPVTIFHEPINIRANNIARIMAQSKKIGVKLNTEVFASSPAWRAYALHSLFTVQRLAEQAGVIDRLHLWPDKDLLSSQGFLDYRQTIWRQPGLTRLEIEKYKQQDQKIYESKFSPWLKKWWARISEWPTE